MQASEVLLKASDRLIEKGWNKGNDGPWEGPNCLQGAIMHEAPNRKVAQQAMTFTALAIAEHEKGWDPANGVPTYVSAHNLIGSITHWNDRPDRKESVVIGMLQRAAIIAKEQESTRAKSAGMRVTASR